MDVFSGLSGEKDTVFAAPAPLALLIPKYLETTPLMYYYTVHVAMLVLANSRKSRAWKAPSS